MRICLLTIVVMVLSATTGFAQNFWKTQDRSFWDGPNLVRLFRSQDANPKGVVLAPDGHILRSALIPIVVRETARASDRPVRGHIDYLDETFYWFGTSGTQFTPERKPFAKITLFEHETNGEWKELGSGTFTGSGPTTMIRLGNGNYLAVSANGMTFRDGGKSYPFATIRVTQNRELEVVDRQDAGFEKPFFDADAKVRYGQLFMTLLVPDFIRTGDLIVMPTAYGIVWIFDAKTGALRRTVRLYPGISEERLMGKSESVLLPGLLGIAARPDGNILISARTEDAVLNGMQGGQPRADRPDSDVRDWADVVNMRYPVVDWWELDPVTGKFEREPPPPFMPESLHTEKSVLDFNWRYKPDGTIETISFDALNERFSKKDATPQPKPEKKSPAPAKAAPSDVKTKAVIPTEAPAKVPVEASAPPAPAAAPTQPVAKGSTR